MNYQVDSKTLAALDSNSLLRTSTSGPGRTVPRSARRRRPPGSRKGARLAARPSPPERGARCVHRDGRLARLHDILRTGRAGTVMLRVLNEYLSAMIDVILGQGAAFRTSSATASSASSAPRGTTRITRGTRCSARSGCRRNSPPQPPMGARGRNPVRPRCRSALGDCLRGRRGLPPPYSKYAVVGDPVNTVARLEELNRHLGTEIVRAETSSRGWAAGPTSRRAARSRSVDARPRSKSSSCEACS